MVNGKLPDSWTTERIGDICFVTKLAGFEFTKYVKYLDDGEIPVIRAQNVTRQGFHEGNFIYVKRDVFEQLTRSRLKGGDVLMAFVGSVGNVGIVPMGKEYFLGPNVALIRTDQKRVFNKYLYYYLSSEGGKSGVLRFSKSTTQSSISMGNIRDVVFPFPPLPEQERIVAKIEELFTQLDAGTFALERVRAGLRRYKASVLKAACEGKLFDKGVIEELPEGWQWIELERISERVSVGHVGITSEFYCDSSEGIPFIRSQNVRPGKLDLKNVRYITREFHNKLKKSQLQAGDLLVVRVGANRGDSCVVPNLFEKLNCANIIFARPKSIDYSPYLDIYFQSQQCQKMLLDMTTGSAQGVINTKSVAKVMVPLPSLEEQRRIVAEVERRLSVARQVESSVEEALVRASRLRQAVLKSAFEGKLL